MPDNLPDLDALERLAMLATPGPWTDETEKGETYPHCVTADGYYIASAHAACPRSEDGAENAAFIAAANPSVVLALIAEVRALRERVDAHIERNTNV